MNPIRITPLLITLSLAITLSFAAGALTSCTTNRGAHPSRNADPNLQIRSTATATGTSTGTGTATESKRGVSPSGDGDATSLVDPHPGTGASGGLESRGVWLTLNELLESKDAILARLDRLRDAGLNTIYVDVQMRGYVIYAGSAVLPQLPQAAEKVPDLLDWLIPAIHERGMKAEAWAEYGFYAYWTQNAATDPSKGRFLDEHPELLSIDADGRTFIHHEKWGDYYALCPSNPGSHGLLLALYREILARFPFDGISFDRIRYATGDHCHCAYCKRAFQKDTGLELRKFPPRSPEADALSRWRKLQLVGFMQQASTELRKNFPDKRITSAVVPPETIDEKGQDWPEWLIAGYVDAVMPMLYAPDLGPSLRRIDLLVPRGSYVFHGLDASNGIQTLQKQIAQARGARTTGITLWYGSSVNKLLPELQSGAFKTPARSPLYSAP